MIRLFIALFVLILLAGVIGVDACSCGQGPMIRKNLQSIFTRPCPSVKCNPCRRLPNEQKDQKTH